MIDEAILNQIDIRNETLRTMIRTEGRYMEIPKNQEILREGQYVKVVPIVLSGLLKVYTRYNGKELLLYYIKPSESCIMSFTSGIQERPSKIFALADEDTSIIALPTKNLSEWSRKMPELNQLFLAQYSMRYLELLSSLNHLLFDSLEEKILKYIENKITLQGKRTIKVTHKQIASDLATSREVVSRVLKKLESQGIVMQDSDGITLVK